MFALSAKSGGRKSRLEIVSKNKSDNNKSGCTVYPPELIGSIVIF
jgi:hypothetical protein